MNDNTIGYLTLGTAVDTEGVDEGVKKIKKEYNNENIVFETMVSKEDIEEAKKLGDAIQEAYENYKELTSNKDIMFESDVLEAQKLKQEIIEMVNLLEEKTGEKLRLKGINLVEDNQKDTIKKLDKLVFGLSRNMGGVSRKFVNIFSIIKQTLPALGMIGIVVGTITALGSVLTKVFKSAINGSEELRTKVEFIKFTIQSIIDVIGEALSGVINSILDAIVYIIGYIGGIVKAIFKIDIFSKVTAENFKAMQKSASDIRKSFAGFDEMTTLDDSGGLGITSDINSAIGLIDELIDKLKQGQKEGESFVETWFPANAEEGVYTGADFVTEGIKEGNLGKVFKGVIMYWGNDLRLFLDLLNQYVIQPITEFIGGFIEDLGKVWNFIYDIFVNFDEHWNNLKKGISQAFDGFKLLLILTYNWVIDLLNGFLKNFGIKLDKIEYRIDETGKLIIGESEAVEKDLETSITDTAETIGKEIDENVTGNIQNSIDKGNELSETEFEANIKTNKIDEANNSLGTMISKLWDITKSIWNISFTLSPSSYAVKSAVSSLEKLLGIDIPFFAKGGIVNLPSRGVPVGGALTGERGAEGVIPLTDSQQMELLGEAIGKYITVNANITNTMNGRVISREIQRIQNESDFAFNK